MNAELARNLSRTADKGRTDDNLLDYVYFRIVKCIVAGHMSTGIYMSSSQARELEEILLADGFALKYDPTYGTLTISWEEENV